MIFFGPAGNGDAFYVAGHKSSLAVPAYLAAQGLNAYEYQSGRGVNVKEEFCRQLAAAATQHGIRLSLHAPYFINPATDDPKIVASSRRHLVKALAAATAMGAAVIVVHSGSVGKGSRQEALARAERFLAQVAVELLPAYPGVGLCLETMGKANQLGTLEEVSQLCQVDGRYRPAVDFGHLHARGEGAIRGKDDYERVLDSLASTLGGEAVQNLHIHFSPIEYGRGGEIRHRTFGESEFGPDFRPLAAIIARDKLTPTIISESAGTQVEDALAMKGLVAAFQAGEGGEDV